MSCNPLLIFIHILDLRIDRHCFSAIMHPFKVMIVKFRIIGEHCRQYAFDGEGSAHYDQNCRIISDDSSSIRKFCKNNRFKSVPLTEGYHKTKDGKHISHVNSLHSDLKDLIRKKRGLGLRHLQGYLNLIVFKRRFILNIERKLYDLTSFDFIKVKQKLLNNKDICKKPYPISLSDIYERYHYGMYALPTQ